MTRSMLSAVALSALALLSVSAQAQQSFATPEAAIKHRQTTLREMQQNFKVVGDMAGGRAAFDAKVAEEKAARAAELIKLPWSGFGPGTEGGKASPAIWKEQDKFKAAAANSEEALAKLAVAAKTGNLDTIKAALGAAGATCKACHDAFRN